MIKITCDICMDLMPIVQDGVASEDSVVALKQHLEQCPSCRSIYEGEIAMPSDSNRILKKLQKKMQIFAGMLLIFGMFFGLSLTASNEMFLNSLIMPVVGGIAYILFRWKSCYIVPLLIFVTQIFINIINLITKSEHLYLLDLLMWTILYSIFAIIGTVIVGLLHFALRKETS